MRAKKWHKFNFTLLILILLILTFHTQAAYAKPDKKNPEKIRLSNVRDTQFTVSWITRERTAGKINYGPGAGLGKVAYDNRGDAVRGGLHHITVRHLKPNTLYYFEIVSGNKTYKNGKKLYTCKTGPTIIPVKCDVAYGRVYHRLTGRHKIPYKQEAIVYITLVDKDGAGSSAESATESAILEESGYWSRELANFREEGLSQLFSYSDSGDALKIEVQTGINPVAEIIVDTADDSPTKDIELIQMKRRRGFKRP